MGGYFLGGLNLCLRKIQLRTFNVNSFFIFQEDFLLRHYDSGECKGLLGHTRASVLWHRAQVIGIFAGFGILLLIASPLLLMAAPCIFCCNCKTCQKVS